MAMYRQAVYRYATFRFHLSWPYIDMPRIPLPCHPHPQYVMAPSRHVFHCYHSLYRARKTSCHKFTHSRVIFQITLCDSSIHESLSSLLQVLVFLQLRLLQVLVFIPFHLPIFPLHLEESKTPLPLSYINPATP
jgi:hypothetical protein